jgi:uncharacterized OsmC-like protein
MMATMDDFDIVVGAGTLRSTSPDAVHFPHRWTQEGATVESAFTGGHLLHLAVGGCVLNDVYREAQRLHIDIRGVRVTTTGAFDPESWHSTGITYTVTIDSPASSDQVGGLLAVVDAVAEMPKAIRAGGPVQRHPVGSAAVGPAGC